MVPLVAAQTSAWSLSFDAWIIIVGALCAVAASLLGNFLVLRRMSMLGDAISHAVLPGLAASFLISDSRSSWPMFVGAVTVGVLTAFLTECLRGWGEVDEGASMGVVFTSLFALGLIMIVRAADHVDLDPNCVLYGAIELTPLDTWRIAGHDIPRVALILAALCVVNAIFVTLFYKEMVISSFDPGLASSAGVPPRWFHYALMTLVAITAVCSFEAVGNILVVAMLVIPPAAAYLLTDRLSTMIGLSVVLAVMSAGLGHVSAMTVPAWWGYRSTSTSGMMTVVAGLLFGLCLLFAPRHGIVVKLFRRTLLSLKILAEDLIGVLYRGEERGQSEAAALPRLAEQLLASRWAVWTVARWLRSQGLLTVNAAGYSLSAQGREWAAGLVRSHRLWEQYLVTEGQVPADRIHSQAERLEHYTDAALRQQLHEHTAAPARDPHGSPIPPESSR